jgi:hypothetical protein
MEVVSREYSDILACTVVGRKNGLSKTGHRAYSGWMTGVEHQVSKFERFESRFVVGIQC